MKKNNAEAVTDMQNEEKKNHLRERLQNLINNLIEVGRLEESQIPDLHILIYETCYNRSVPEVVLALHDQPLSRLYVLRTSSVEASRCRTKHALVDYYTEKNSVIRCMGNLFEEVLNIFKKERACKWEL